MPSPESNRAVADRNLLFGILALQMDFIRRDALIKGMHTWVLEKAKTLGQIFVAQGDLAADVRAVLELLVDKHYATRPPSTSGAEDVEQSQADEPVTAHAEPWHVRLRRWIRHRRGLVGSGVVLLAMGLTVVITANEQRLRRVADTERTEAEKQHDEAERQRGEAEKQKREADFQRNQAERERNRADRYLYFSRVKLAKHAWDENDIPRMDELLEQTQPERTGSQLLHAFERNYLLRVRHSNLLELRGHTSATTGVSYSADGQRVASTSWDGTVKIWDARTGQESLTLKGHTDAVNSVSFSPDGQRLASAGGDKTVKVWDARTGQELLTLQGHNGAVSSVSFSPDGQRLASGGGDETVKVWDARTWQELLTLKGHIGAVSCVSFSPDGLQLASAGRYATVTIWDARTGQEMLTLKGHKGVVSSVSFSPDGQRLASAGGDETVKVWDACTGQELLTLKGHNGDISSVSFSPDGQRLASAGRDKTVKIWDATPVSEGSNLQRQTLSYFRFVAETIVLKDYMVQQIRQTPTLTEPAREQALSFAENYREIPSRLNDASWSVVRWSWARPGAYPLALRQAEAACRQEPENWFFQRTLGGAQYRAGQYAAALETMTLSHMPNAARLKRLIAEFKAYDPVALAFLVMTQFQLGQKAEAATTLGRLRDVIKQWRGDREAEEIVQEAEKLMGPKPGMEPPPMLKPIPPTR